MLGAPLAAVRPRRHAVRVGRSAAGRAPVSIPFPKHGFRSQNGKHAGMKKGLLPGPFLVERTGIEPVTSGLQSRVGHGDIRRRTPTNPYSYAGLRRTVPRAVWLRGGVPGRLGHYWATTRHPSNRLPLGRETGPAEHRLRPWAAQHRLARARDTLETPPPIDDREAAPPVLRGGITRRALSCGGAAP